MKSGRIRIEFEHYWHCSTGEAGQDDVDLLPVTEPCGLPFVPGRTLRGRLRQSGRESGLAEDVAGELFGKEENYDSGGEGALQITSAVMTGEFAQACRRFFDARGVQRPEIGALFADISSTAMQNGVARRHSLRRVRYVVPVTVEAEYEVPGEKEYKALLDCVDVLQAIGKGKHDGFGWCRAKCEPSGASDSSAGNDQTHVEPGRQSAEAVTVTFTLLDDTVLSAGNATVGAHRTLDYIPGSALLGASAAELFRSLPAADVAAMLAQGKIRFGNAYPVHGEEHGIPVPFAWHRINSGRDDSLTVLNLAREQVVSTDPVQQIRRGYYVEDTAGSSIHRVRTTHKLKTAVSEKLSDYEISREGQLFGYEAISAGQKFRATIEVDPEFDTAPEVLRLLRSVFGVGRIRLGRSKGTEYGRVECRVEATAATAASFTVPADKEIFILALSDLALTDEYGYPKLVPEPRDFGDNFKHWKTSKRRSFLRHRRYALWNLKRRGPDLERQVICKGSVIVLSPPERREAGSKCEMPVRIGAGQAEGLGQLLINPAFLQLNSKNLHYSQAAKWHSEAGIEPLPDDLDDGFSEWILDRHAQQRQIVDAAKLALQWTEDWTQKRGKAKIFRKPTQWRRIIEVIRVSADKSELTRNLNEMFNKGKMQKEWDTVKKDIVAACDVADSDLLFPALHQAAHRLAMLARQPGDGS